MKKSANTSITYFITGEEGAPISEQQIIKISRASLDKLEKRKDNKPFRVYADSMIRCADVVVSKGKGEPKGIKAMFFRRLYFDGDGWLDRQVEQNAAQDAYR
ncbi:MAG TPA: hypothetical protein VK308_15855, partial [Pyrinomonadaceae bacterium]|nr:hypothetical protein [Pyrinomonadaceae bacterium]